MLFYGNINLLTSLLISMILVIPIYYLISTFRISDYSKRKSWKQATGKCSLKGDRFITNVKELCMHKGYQLLEISPNHAYIKELMSMSSGGVLYYIELSEPDTVTIWARGSIYKSRINKTCLISMVNMFYTE